MERCLMDILASRRSVSFVFTSGADGGGGSVLTGRFHNNMFRHAHMPPSFSIGFVLFRFGTLWNVVACTTMLRGRLFALCFRQQRERRPSLLSHHIRCFTSRMAGMHATCGMAWTRGGILSVKP
eukprot:jgi/Mesvir1/8184/Mv25346-RA.1